MPKDTRAVQHPLLAATCQRLAEHVDNQQLTRQGIRLALLCPAILMCAVLAIFAFLLGVVIPDVVQIFAHHQQALPATIRVSMALNESGQRFALPFAGVLFAAGVFARLALHALRRRLRWHGLLSDVRVERALGLFEPLMLAMTGGVMLFIGLAILMPILSLTALLA